MVTVNTHLTLLQEPSLAEALRARPGQGRCLTGRC
jgi:hypothetical protein